MRGDNSDDRLLAIPRGQTPQSLNPTPIPTHKHTQTDCVPYHTYIWGALVRKEKDLG